MKISFWERRQAALRGYSIDADGHKIYNPIFYRFRGSEKERIRFNIVMGAYLFLLTGLCILSGIPQSGELWYCRYVVIPFSLEILGLFVLAFTLVRYLFENHPISAMMYKRTIPVLKIVSVIFVMITLAEFITGLIYIISEKPADTLAGCIIFESTKLISIVLSIIARRIIGNTQWIKEVTDVPEGDNPENLLLQ